MSAKEVLTASEGMADETPRDVVKKPAGKTSAAKLSLKAKAKAKVKAMAAQRQPKAKAKASCKAKAKAKAKASVLKKPAGFTLAATIQDLEEKLSKDNDDDEDGEAGNSSEENEDNGARDKGKAIKFRKMRSELPPHVLHLIDTESRAKSSPRAFQSYVINKLYRRNSKLSLALDRPSFTEHQRASWLTSAQRFSVIMHWNNRIKW